MRNTRIHAGTWNLDATATLAAQLGGEEWPASPTVTIGVAPRGIRLIVPRPGSG